MLEDFKPFLDKFGLIAQKDSAGADGGDSMHRFGLIYSSLKVLGITTWVDDVTPIDEYYDKVMPQYEKEKDTYVRHPDLEKWYSNPLNFSRDQTTMALKAMLMRGDGRRARGLLKQLAGKFGFHKNVYPNYAKPGDADYKKKVPDIITPSEIADVLRSYRSKMLYPIICILDLFKFIDIAFAERDDNISKAKGKRTDYYVMLCMDIAVSRAVQDTFVMRAVAKKLAKSDYKSGIEWIFSPRWDDPPVAKLLIPVCERYIDNAG